MDYIIIIKQYQHFIRSFLPIRSFTITSIIFGAIGLLILLGLTALCGFTICLFINLALCNTNHLLVYIQWLLHLQFGPTLLRKVTVNLLLILSPLLSNNVQNIITRCLDISLYNTFIYPTCDILSAFQLPDLISSFLPIQV